MRDPGKLTSILGLVLLVVSALPVLIWGHYFWLGGFVGLFLICIGTWVRAVARLPLEARRLR